jgi:hypothetical protein
MRAIQFITELFAPGKPWKWDYNSDTEAEATFVIGDIQYKFYAFSSDAGIWEVEFKIVEGGDPGNRFGITGTGNAAEVMSTVTDILRAFLAKYQDKINTLMFSAKESSRQALYARMAKRLLPTWEFKQLRRSFALTAPKATR